MFTLQCNGRLLEIDQPIVMGIINITPDSFHSGSRFENETAILREVEQMLKEGATIIDIGGQSSRPASNLLTDVEELKRILEPISQIAKTFPEAYISVDTFYAAVAKEAVAAGACMVNDISGGHLDPAMIATVAALKTPYIIMHMKGTPQNMQTLSQYNHISLEIMQYFIERIQTCSNAGIRDIILDPGYGFAKTIEQNFELLKKSSVFKVLEKPLLAGLSRKSTIYKTLNITPEAALNGTTVLNTIALLNGANILRVHDVKEARETIQLIEKYYAS